MQRNVRQEIIAKIEESFLIAEKFFKRSFDRPKTVIFKRNGTCGGHSNYSKSELMFQLDIAEHNADSFIKTIVPHEVAHYVQRAVYGYSRFVKPHGREWKFIMTSVFNLSPDRCHSYDVSVTKIRKRSVFMYGCGCSNSHKVSSVVHNRIQSGKKKYTCVRCGQFIKYLHPIKKMDSQLTEIEKLQNKIEKLKQQMLNA